MSSYTSDTFNFIIAFENGDLESAEQFIDGFATLIKTGLAWQLQGTYGRQAASLIENGYIDREGNVLRYPEEE